VEHIHDCVVVGAGPAGSAAALQMARDGLDVVLIERGRQPGEKNVMSGVLVTEMLQCLVPDFRERAPLERCITGGYELYVLGEEELLRLPSLRNYRRGGHTAPLHTVFRSQFDAWFAGEAAEAGVEVFTETLVEDLLWQDGRVAGVQTLRGDLWARVVLGADGVNSTVAERAGLGVRPASDNVSLIVREVLDLPSERIEERFVLRPGEGVLSLFYGAVHGPNGKKGTYYSELYTNRDSLSLTTEVPLDTLVSCGMPAHEVLGERERHPYISRLIEGAALREYQAHLIPYGGVDDLTLLYGDGVLLAGDAGRFTTKEGAGSWPAMASGVAAAKTVQRACARGDYSRATMASYIGFLEQEGMLDVQAEARKDWSRRKRRPGVLTRNPDGLVHLSRRYFEDWLEGQESYEQSLWNEAYHELVRPVAPWYARWPLDLAAWVDAGRWRREQAAARKVEDR
jgi:electron transfer flavoprotein-quinone oxidoreductase